MYMENFYEWYSAATADNIFILGHKIGVLNVDIILVISIILGLNKTLKFSASMQKWQKKIGFVFCTFDKN